jgi:EAL domain-containing protein (putative c-di-GMP-specific phosphodiesterase class I)
MAQGYFIAKPMAHEKIPGWLRHWNLKRDSLGD